MTIMAGIMSLWQEVTIPDSMCLALDAALSRDPADVPERFRGDRVYLAKVDIRAFGSPALSIIPGRSVAMLVGEPLLDYDGTMPGCHPRAVDLERIQAGIDRSELSVVTQGTGIYCFAHYGEASGALTLISDKLALRPLYYCLTDNYFFFASSLRVLEAMETVPKRMDLRGVTEISAFGFPLADRTPYLDIKALEPGQLLSASSAGLRLTRYWRWDGISRWTGVEEELAREAYRRFEKAVRRRLATDTSTLAFLSGGLDSRVVVGLLRQLGAAVHTFTFGIPGTQDVYCASAFAKAAGTIHEQTEPAMGPVNEWAKMLAGAWASSPQKQEYPPERPGIAWSGDGGSVIVGRVYLLPSIVELLKAGKRGQAIDAYLVHFGSRVVKGLVRGEYYRDLAGIPTEGVNEEIEKIDCEDEVRRFYLFLILNDQRYHLREHYETQDLHRLELHQPFFDSSFVETVVSGSTTGGLYHRFYEKWLGHFPPVVTSVPWQTYPGHQPCPLPKPDHLGYQWSGALSRHRERLQKEYYLGEASRMLGSADFPDHLMTRRSLRLAALIHRLGLRDYGYLIKTARLYDRYWKIAEGKTAG